MSAINETQYLILQDTSLRLERCLIVFILLVLLSAENISQDKYLYRKRVFLLLKVLFFCEVTSYFFKLNDYSLIQKLIHKFGVELIYIILNCSIIYNMNKFFAHSSQSLSYIVYGSIGIIVIYIILSHTKYSQFARGILYMIGVILSLYSLSILYRMKQYFKSLSEVRQDIIIPIGHNALFRTEWIILALNLFMFVICFCIDKSIKYPGHHLVNQIRICIKILYLLKIYVVITQGRNIEMNNNQQFENKEAPQFQSQFQSQTFDDQNHNSDHKHVSSFQLTTQNNKTYMRVHNNSDDVDVI